MLIIKFLFLSIPPPCQVEEHEPKHRVTFSDMSKVTPVAETCSRNKIAEKWKSRLEQRQEKGILANIVEDNIPQERRRYITGVDDKELRHRIMDRTIPSTIADSSTTSGIGAKDDPSHRTGEPSGKRFILPSGKVIQPTEKAEYPFNVRAPANESQATLATQHGKVCRRQLHHSL